MRTTPFSIGPLQLVTAATILIVLLAGAINSTAQEELFKSRRVNPDKVGEYTRGIEGPAVDAAGNLYVTNLKQPGRIGQLKPGATQSEKFADLPPGGVGNGIRFDRDGRMYVADHKTKTVFVFPKGATKADVYFTDQGFNQPNDLAIAKDGTLYASDPKFSAGKGRIWRITRASDDKVRGEIMSSDRDMGSTNGLDLSPDETTLYVSEANSAEVWAYRIEGSKLTSHRLVKKFAKRELDGLRTDVDGRIYVARPGHGVVSILTPDGQSKDIPVLALNPTNLTFGGLDGKTVFVTQMNNKKTDKGFIETFRVDKPGREPCMQFGGAFCPP